MLILRHFHGVLVGKGKDNLRLAIFDEQKDWNAATTLEWRGWLTVETLGILRAYGRLPGVLRN